MLRVIALILAILGPGAGWAAEVIDGDTLVIDGQIYRIEGIDAPERAQRCGTAETRQWSCGMAAKDYLESWIADRSVTCDAHQSDGYDRLIATCTADGEDIGAKMVFEGHAWAFTRYSLTYVDQEKAAAIAGRGIWSAPSVPAWDFRAAKWEVSEQKAPEGCPIKGNISRNGKIYHTPWSQWYDRTDINTSRGERWFCSEDQAIAAGWRAPLR